MSVDKNTEIGGQIFIEKYRYDKMLEAIVKDIPKVYNDEIQSERALENFNCKLI